MFFGLLLCSFQGNLDIVIDIHYNFFYAETIYIDLTVAFDPINHNILPSKFPSIWLSLTTVEWFSGYIREQT